MVFDIDIDEELSKLTPEQTTARGSLNLLNDCSRIGIQDAACMVLAGREHILFDLDVFKEEEFKEFCNDMKNHLTLLLITQTRMLNDVYLMSWNNSTSFRQNKINALNKEVLNIVFQKILNKI